MDKIENFRGLGGYAAGPGRATAHGRLYRSALPADITAADLDRIRRLGIKTVVDLRSDKEEDELHNSLMDVEWIACSRVNLFEALNPEAVKQRDGEDFIAFCCRLYVMMVADSPARICEAIERVADGLKHGAVLIHCRGGKDRTGILAALLLAVAGVDELDIFADYMVSGNYIPSLAGIDTFGSDVRYIKAVWEWITQHHGAPAAYLCAAGLAESRLEDICRLLTE